MDALVFLYCLLRLVTISDSFKLQRGVGNTY